MQLFAQYNPRQPQPEHQLLRFFKSPQEENGEDFYFIRQDNHLLVYKERLYIFPPTSKHYGEQELIANQFEIPLEGIRWLIDIIDEKSFFTPREDGLKVQTIRYKEQIAGEYLYLVRKVGIGCDSPGCVIINGSRRHNSLQNDLQSLFLSEACLLNIELLNFLRSLTNHNFVNANELQIEIKKWI